MLNQEQVLSFIVCLILPMILMVFIAIIGTRERMRYAKRISEKRAKDEYKIWATGKQSIFIRIVLFIALIIITLLCVTSIVVAINVAIS